MFNKKLKTRIYDMNNRINQLEELICPNSLHDWIITEKWLVPEHCGSQVDVYTKRRLQCSKCKKTIIDSNHPLNIQHSAREN